MLFRVGLVILKYSFMKAKTMKDCPTMYESMEVLRHLHSSVTEENVLVPRVRISSTCAKVRVLTSIFWQQMLKLPINEEDMERVHKKVVKQRSSTSQRS